MGWLVAGLARRDGGGGAMSEAASLNRFGEIKMFARGSYGRRLVVLAVLAGLADWLFYNEPVGISVALFGICVWAGMAVCRPMGTLGNMAGCMAVSVAAVLPCIVTMSALALGVAVSGIAFASVSMGLNDTPSWRRAMLVPVMLRGAFWRILVDSWSPLETLIASPFGGWNRKSWFVWVLPVTMGLVFLGLFAQANPVIEIGIAGLNPAGLSAAVPWAHSWFWAFTAGVLWPFLAALPLTARETRVKAISTALKKDSAALALLFGRSAILRSLALFNLMFAVQTAMDFCYLWERAKLPAGLTFANYAHQGAYPLIVTALLAGGFCIAATKPGSVSANSRLCQYLVLLWILQNILLVGSAMWRLKRYVNAYELTELRLAALIWMVLVAVGLTLILARMAFQQSNLWLVQANAVALAATLYLCSFASFPNVVSMYDVKHCLELSGRGEPLDLDYIASLGPQAIPALDLYQIHTVTTTKGKPFAFLSTGDVGETRDDLAAAFLADDAGWRGWNIWRWHLEKYLATHESDA